MLSRDEISVGELCSKLVKSTGVFSPSQGGADSIVGTGDGAPRPVWSKGDWTVSSWCSVYEGAMVDKLRRTFFAGSQGENSSGGTQDSSRPSANFLFDRAFLPRSAKEAAESSCCAGRVRLRPCSSMK